MEPIVDPGDAAGLALRQMLLQRREEETQAAALAHQKFLEGIATRQEDRLSRSEELLIQEKRAELERKTHDDKVKAFENARDNLNPGDIPGPEYADLAKAAGMPSGLTQKPQTTVIPSSGPAEVPGQSLTPEGAPAPATAMKLPSSPAEVTTLPGPMFFGGRASQRLEMQKQAAFQEFSQALQDGEDITTASSKALAKGAHPADLASFITALRPPKEAHQGLEEEFLVTRAHELGKTVEQMTAPERLKAHHDFTEQGRSANGPINVFTMSPEGTLLPSGTMPQGSRIAVTPGATAAIAKTATVKSGLAAVDRATKDLDEADKMGLLGPLSGRFYELMAKAGTTGNSEMDDLIGRLKGDILLTKMHVDAGLGGARAASSPLLLKNWEDIAVHGSKALVSGYLASIRNDLHDSTPILPTGTTPKADAAEAPADLIWDPATKTLRKP